MILEGDTCGDVCNETLVDSFTFAGVSSFDASGNAPELRVGATAHIGLRNRAGNYSGTAIFRLE